MVRKRVSVAEACPNLTKEWYFKLNKDLTPSDVTPGMHRKVWWKCINNPEHIWEANISNRARKNNPRGCPYCSNSKLTEQNCLANVNPVLSKEWCYELNGELTPKEVQAGGKRSVWWECHKCSFKWKAQLYERNRGHYECARCKSLGMKYPEILIDWDYDKNHDLDPFIVSYKSHKKVWWKCSKCGYTWNSFVYERSYGHKTCIGCHSIAVTHPEVAKDWDIELNGSLTPRDVTAGSNKVVWWKCSRNPKHITHMIVEARCESGCSICSKGRNTSVNEVAFLLALKDVFLDALHRKKINNRKAMEADVFLPSLSLAFEYDSYYYHKEKQEADEQKNRDFNENGIRLVRIREKRLPTIECYGSEILILNDWKKPLKDCFNEIIKVFIKWYGQDNKVTPLIELLKDVNIDSKRLEAIDYLASVPISECLAYQNPQLIDEWHLTKNMGVTPWDVRPFSNVKFWWQCSCNPTHQWLASIAKRSMGEGCPYCNGRGSSLIVTKENSLEANFTEIAKQWHPSLNRNITPDRVYMYSTKKYWWQCPNNEEHIWHTSVAKRTRLNRGCHYCTKQKVPPKESLALLRPDLLALWDYDLNVTVSPDTVGINSRRKVWWKCSKGHSWQDCVSRMVNGKCKCKEC